MESKGIPIELNDIMSGFQERMGKLALFDPLFELSRQRKTDRGGKQVAMMELGLLTLLFFFEKKLMRSRKTSVKDLVGFLAAVLEDKYDLDQEELDDIGRRIIHVFRPSSGRKREFSFFHLGTGQEGVHYTSILRTDSYDVATNTQYYALDEDGLELVFATKEFYLEFQLSIHQLLLRKQLEKGEFQGALRQIDEMMIDVETLQDRIVSLEHEIKRSIVSEETFARYRSLLEDIYLRLKRENEEFNELRDFVRETKDRIYAERELMKNQRPYEFIVRIGIELEKVHNEHTRLLQQSMELESSALRAAKESLYYTGMNAFNFEQDIASFLFGTPLPIEAMKGVVAPFLHLEQVRVWSPLTVFAKQQLSGHDDGSVIEESLLALDEEEENFSYLRKRKERLVQVVEALLRCYEKLNRDEVRLSEFIAYLDQDEAADLKKERDFYDCWIILHQRSPIHPVMDEVKSGESDQNLYEAIRSQLQGRTLIIQETECILRVNERYSIQELIIRLGGDQDELHR
ncbi:replicative DNA helicase [Paenibacillus yonginensis]|uniref:Replicative DNA helicase n=1 Tax=Paenibacillus yonginensis TaxID=1462996 RepID=A0A1B1MVK1_9BACL|nr:replicative DNA helicase [Paenibacillus yonginensis]ANS73211.1 replicative DNA helicase [Paenibacillus yonginensis]